LGDLVHWGSTQIWAIPDLGHPRSGRPVKILRQKPHISKFQDQLGHSSSFLFLCNFVVLSVFMQNHQKWHFLRMKFPSRHFWFFENFCPIFFENQKCRGGNFMRKKCHFWWFCIKTNKVTKNLLRAVAMVTAVALLTLGTSCPPKTCTPLQSTKWMLRKPLLLTTGGN
jgi:hypothetical protein